MGRWKVSLLPAVVALSATECGGPRPSSEPLGWGPLPPGALTASHGSKGNAPSRIEANARQNTEETSPSEGDGGAPKRDKVASAPAPSTSGAPSGASSVASPKTAPPNPALVKEFLGEYAGEDVATYRIAGLPDRTERDPKARITVKASDKNDLLLFVLIDSSNGKEICTLSGSLNDSTVAIEAGQKCFEQNEGEASAGATVTKGSAALDKKRLTFELRLDFEMGVEGRKLTGTLDYRFDGKRQ